MKKIIALGISFLLFVPIFGCRADGGTGAGTGTQDTTVAPNTGIQDGDTTNGAQGDAQKQIEEAGDNIDDFKNNTENKENTNKGNSKNTNS